MLQTCWFGTRTCAGCSEVLGVTCLNALVDGARWDYATIADTVHHHVRHRSLLAQPELMARQCSLTLSAPQQDLSTGPRLSQAPRPHGLQHPSALLESSANSTALDSVGV